MGRNNEESVFGLDESHLARMSGEREDRHSYQPRPASPGRGNDGGGANTQPRPAPTPSTPPPPQRGD